MRNLHHSHHHVERHLDSSPVEWEPQAVNGEELALDKRDPQVATQVSIVYVTASKTFAGPVGGYTTMLPSGYSVNHGTLSAPSPEQPTPNPEPSTQVQPSSTKPKHTDQNSKPPQSISFPQSTAQTPTTAPSSSNTQASSTLTSSSVATISPQSSAPTGSYSVASDQPPSLQAAASGSDVTAPAASSSPSAVTKNSDGGMSGGAKAGLAIGIIFIIALIAGGAFLLFRRKKRQEESHERIEDNEKVTAPSGMVQAERAPSARSARTASTAPRLSLPALTQFSANLNGEQRPTVGNKLEMTSRPIQAETAAFVAPAAQQTKSMWERPGERGNATESVNPFGDHAASVAAPVGAAVVGAAAGAVTARKVNDRRRSSDVVPKPLSIKSNHSQTSLASSAAHSAVSDGAPSSTNDSEFQVGTASTASSAIPAAVGAAAIPASLSPPAGPPSNVHRVQMEFKPSMEDELELRPGQIVRILHEYDDGWALCIRMDRSQQGVAPRTCLSKLPLKPRPAGPQPQQSGPRSAGPPPLRPPIGPSSMVPRPLTPNSGRNSPIDPFADAPASSGGRARSRSNAPGPQRTLSPGAYSGVRHAGEGQQSRRRSKSVTDLQPKIYQAQPSTRMPFTHMSSSSLGSVASSIPARKPVPGHLR